MRTRSMKMSAEIAPKFGGNYVKNELQTKVDCNLHPFPSPSEFKELATTIKVENYNKRDVDLVANIVKSELIEFHSNQPEESFRQNDVKTVLLEKIPKIETEILGDEPLASFSDKEDHPYNTKNFSGSDLNFDPDRDPFEDIDCDPSFSQISPKNRNNLKTDSTTENEPIKYAAHVNDSFSGILPETRCHGSVKSSLLTANPTQYDHMRETVNSKFCCKLCLEVRYSETWLQTHLETCAKTHKNRNRFCVPCNKLFTHSDGRRMHNICIHEIKDAELHNVGKIKRSAKKLNQQLPYQCQFCVCAFPVVQLLVPHLASHPEVNTTDEKDLKQRPYRCQECPSAFRYYSLYTLHMLSHKNERAFKCPMPNCKHAYKAKGNLTNHLQRIHSEEKPFKCPEPNCGKAFLMKNMLQRHSVVHSEKRPFECSHLDCYKTFKTKETFRKHLTLHTEARRLKHMTKTFKCPERGCFAAFTLKYNLNSHIKQKHKL